MHLRSDADVGADDQTYVDQLPLQTAYYLKYPCQLTGLMACYQKYKKLLDLPAAYLLKYPDQLFFLETYCLQYINQLASLAAYHQKRTLAKRLPL